MTIHADSATRVQRPVPAELDSEYQLPTNAQQDFERDGFIRLPQVLDPATISYFEPEITQQVIDLNTQHLPLEQRSTYDKAFLQIENLWQHSDLVKQLVFSKRLAKIAADLLGTRGVRLYHDQALYKEPSGGFTPWHVDQHYWPLSSDRTCTIWIPLQDTPMELGPLSFAQGSHRLGLGRELDLGDQSEQSLADEVASRGLTHVAEPYAVGDVSYHLGWTVHRADRNVSDQPRRVMTMIYMDADILATEPDNEHREADLERWLGNAAPGTVPDGPLNPVLYSRD